MHVKHMLLYWFSPASWILKFGSPLSQVGNIHEINTAWTFWVTEFQTCDNPLTLCAYFEFYEQIWFFFPCSCLCTTWIRMLALHSSQKMASSSLQLGVVDSCEPWFKYWPLNHLCARLAGDLHYWTICPPLCSLLITTLHC